MYSIVLAVILSTASFHQQCPEGISESFVEIELTIQDLKNEVKELHDRSHKRHLRKHIKALKRNLRKMKRMLCREGQVIDQQPIVQQPVDNPQNYLLPHQHFLELLKQAKNAYRADERLFYVQEASQNYCLTAKQGKQFVDVFHSTTGKGSVVSTILPTLVDPQNAYMLLEGIHSVSVRQSLQVKILNHKGYQKCRVENQYFSDLQPLDLTRLVAAQRKTHRQEDSFFVIKNAMKGKCLKVGQTQKLLKTFYSSNYRLAAFSFLLPRISDRSVAFRLLKSFNYSKQGEVRRMLRTVQQRAECVMQPQVTYQNNYN